MSEWKVGTGAGGKLKGFVKIEKIEFNLVKKTIFLASRHYSDVKRNDGCNTINLIKLPHGNMDAQDTEALTIPRFIKYADEINHQLLFSEKIWVHCNNGRSRTGSVVAVYLIKHEKMEPNKA